MYGPIFTPLLTAAPLNELGLGRPDRTALAKIKRLSLDDGLAPRRIVDREMAEACRAGLFLLYNCFDESHAISQSIETPSGNYWHGILHRREPDYGNAKYWFRRVGVHPVFEPLAVAGRELAAADELDRAAQFLAEQEIWDPFRFVDLCAAATQERSTCELLCRQIQRRECELLFDYCYLAATGQRPNSRG
jgi:hypothetical protein